MQPSLEHKIRSLDRAIYNDPQNADLYVELARCHSASGDIPQAIRQLEKAKLLNPNHLQASFELGLNYSQQKAYDNAIREWEKMVDKDGDLDLDSIERHRFSSIREAAKEWDKYRRSGDSDVFQLYSLGVASMALGGLDDARQAFESVIKINSAFKKASYYLANIYHKLNNNRLAIECCHKFLSSRPRDPHGHYLYGLILLEEGRTAQAIDALRNTFVDRPRHVKAHLKIASAYLNLMQFEEAIKHLNTVLQVSPDSAIGHFLMGKCQEKLYQMDEAINSYAQAVAIQPNHKEAHFALGILYRAIAEHEKALAHFKITLELDPSESEAHYYTGMVLLALRRFDEAIKPLIQACKLSSGNAFAYYALGKACIGSGRFDKAVECFRRGLEINPRDTKARSALGQAFFQKNELTLAKRQFEKVLEENPREREARYFLGMCQFRLHEYDKAVESYRLAANVNPNSAIGHFTEGAIMASKNKYRQALESYRQASSFSPDSDSDLEIFSTLQLLATVGINNALEGIQLQKFAQKQEELFESFVIVLSRLLDARDPYTKYHSQRVAHIGYVLATDGISWAINNGRLPPSARLSPKTQKGIWVGGLLHDIGKIGIRDEVLNKPGKLTDEEYAQIKEHPTIGYEGLKLVPFIWDEVLPIVRFHHEKWNGHGYPTGRAGDEIPFEAQIIGVADFFDALTTQRPYRKAFSSRKALGIMIEEKGTFFNPVLIEAFEGIIELVEAVPEAPLDETGSYIFDKEQDVFDGLKMSWDYSA